jgi:hypothetical protein
MPICLIGSFFFALPSPSSATFFPFVPFDACEVPDASCAGAEDGAAGAAVGGRIPASLLAAACDAALLGALDGPAMVLLLP